MHIFDIEQIFTKEEFCPLWRPIKFIKLVYSCLRFDKILRSGDRMFRSVRLSLKCLIVLMKNVVLELRLRKN